jgi:hypothetical protein
MFLVPTQMRGDAENIHVSFGEFIMGFVWHNEV